ncbi:hypothetical protein C7M56_18065 [Clostridium botulinum]|uniref:RelA/SpoT domain-containing protein n=2 Tax=Clostridium botulinum TaxID=1491 RepID=A0ABC8D0F9_CLOBO|nr:hypothetical protein C7M56_18065 [Clostridium botulinum]
MISCVLFNKNTWYNKKKNIELGEFYKGMGLTENNDKLCIDEYNIIFSCIYKNYIRYCQEWDTIRQTEINLKKKCICDIYNLENQLDKQFEKYIHSFRKNLSNVYISILMDLQQNIDINRRIKFNGRVKTEDSILNKIHKKAKQDGGKFPINNCINDLLGLRIIDPYYKENIIYIENELKKFKNNGYKLRYMDRLNNEYKAYHVYLKKDNKSFPIELQIWDAKYEQVNINSHKEYKQDYINDIIKNYKKL